MRNARLEPSGDPIELLAKLENCEQDWQVLGYVPLGPETMLLDFLDRLLPDYEQEVRRLHAKDTLRV